MQINGHDENDSNEFQPATVIDHFRQICLNVIGTPIALIRKRFDQPAFFSIEQFLGRVTKQLGSLDYIMKVYSDDIDRTAIETEFSFFKAIFESNNVEHFNDINQKEN